MTLVVVLIAYLFVLIVFFLYSLYAVHHLNEYGYSGDASQLALKIYLGYSSIVIMVSLVGIFVGLMSL